ncbi:MAG: hypothetical protein NTW62_01050 [Candidatus Nomurabacteria bacterium]|nr:hypothetical protein [Candidatus Nomurabacteria bacterium]
MKKILKSKFALISLLSISILIFSSFLFSKHVEASVSFNFVTKWGTMGSGNGQFNMPVGIAVDSGDNIYVGERYTNNRIQNFTSNGNFISLFNSPNGNGQFNLSDNGEAMTVDHHDHVYVSGNSAVNEFDTAGHFIKTFGFGVLDGSNVFQICNAGSTCRDGIDAGSNLGSFSGVGHIAVDDQDNVYVPDWNYNVIQKFTPTGTPVFRFGGNFDTTVSVAIDSSGNIYTTDYTMYVQKFDSNGNFITSWGGYGSADGQFNYPSNIAIDSTDLIYVFDSGNNRIEVFDTDGNFITKFGSRGSADGQIRGVVDKGTIAIDSHDNIYITDFYNYRVQEFTKVISQNRSLSVPPKLELRIVDNASANTAGVINTADNTASAPPATAATSLYLSSSNTTQGISIYWAGDTLASPNNTLDPNKCSAYTDVSGSSWSWGGPAYTGTSIAPTTVWSTPIVDHPTIPTTYYVSCASSVGGPTLIASITVTPAIVAPTPSTALSLQIVNGTSAPVFSNSNNTTPTPYPTPMTIPLGSSIDISWAGDTLPRWW